MNILDNLNAAIIDIDEETRLVTVRVDLSLPYFVEDADGATAPATATATAIIRFYCATKATLSDDSEEPLRELIEMDINAVVTECEKERLLDGMKKMDYTTEDINTIACVIAKKIASELKIDEAMFNKITEYKR